MRTVLGLLLGSLLLTGCGSGSWTLIEKGPAWDAVHDATFVHVAPLTLTPKAAKEVREEGWEQTWPHILADRFSEGVNDADKGLQAGAPNQADLILRVASREFYNGNGYSAFGSNPAYFKGTATLETRDGRKVASLEVSVRKGDYMGAGPWKALMHEAGEDFAAWARKNR